MSMGNLSCFIGIKRIAVLASHVLSGREAYKAKLLLCLDGDPIASSSFFFMSIAEA